jgi:DNA-binding HxlR family transcriptional regulator
MTQGSYKQFCPVARAAEVLCRRWTIVLLRELVAGSTRFNDLRRGVPRMSPALLSQRLKELETAGILYRKRSPADPDVFEYCLIDAGSELRPIVEAFGMWGQRFIRLALPAARLAPHQHAGIAGEQRRARGRQVVRLRLFRHYGAASKQAMRGSRSLRHLGQERFHAWQNEAAVEKRAGMVEARQREVCNVA